MSPLHVVLVIDSLTYGGTEKSVSEMLPAISRRGPDVTVVQLIERGGYSDELRSRGIRVLTAQSPGRLGRIADLRRIIVELGADLVHTQLFEADLVGRTAGALARVPVVSSLVNVGYGPEHGAAPGVRRHRLLLARLADAGTARLVRHFHAVSETVRDTMAERLRIPISHIDVIPRGRIGEQLGRRTLERSRAVRSELGLVREERPIILAVGRQEWQKGIDVLLASLPLVSAPAGGTVLVAGRDGNQSASLRRLAKSVPNHWDVRFLGARDDVPDLLVAADVLAFPSRWEGLPGTLIEALALETPIVATNIRQNWEVVGGLPGARLVAGDAPRPFADALTRALAEPVDVAGHRGRFEARYEMEAVATRMRDFYLEAVEAH